MNEQMKSLTSHEGLRIAFFSLSFRSQVCEMNSLNNKLETLPILTPIINASNSKHLLIILLFAKSCPTLCDPMEYSMPDLPVPHYLLEFAQVQTEKKNSN